MRINKFVIIGGNISRQGQCSKAATGGVLKKGALKKLAKVTGQEVPESLF